MSNSCQVSQFIDLTTDGLDTYMQHITSVTKIRIKKIAKVLSKSPKKAIADKSQSPVSVYEVVVCSTSSVPKKSCGTLLKSYLHQVYYKVEGTFSRTEEVVLINLVSSEQLHRGKLKTRLFTLIEPKNSAVKFDQD